MNIVSSARPEQIQKWCALGLRYRIHFRDGGGMLEAWYKRPSGVQAMAVALDEKNKPIAIALVLKRGWRDLDYVDMDIIDVGVYTKYRYRRRGIGTELVTRCQRLIGKSVRGDQWDNQSTAFYQSMA